MKVIGIIGGGFTGTMTAVQIIEKSTEPCEIVLINEGGELNKGIAYNPYSEKHLLNVITGKMSAFPDQPDHFLDWIMGKPNFQEKDRTLIANSFLPRRLFGEYIHDIWQNSLRVAESKAIKITIINSVVADLNASENNVTLLLGNNRTVQADSCVIATGNNLPGNPQIKNEVFYDSKNYFQDPWEISSVKDVKDHMPVIILGNGLTMVDTVFGLLEHGFQGEVYSISPNGFNILPHRHNGLKYSKLTEEMSQDLSLFELVKLVNRHIKTVREYGVSAEPVIESLRPHTQRIWRSLTDREKELFMSRLRHLWGVARHRIPLHSHDRIQQLRIDGKLHIVAGRIMDIQESEEGITLVYSDKREKTIKELNASRVINCTGPETDLLRLDGSFLKKCLLRGLLAQDKLKLGISADINTFQVILPDGTRHTNLFTLGSNLKGELWESTAVNELRAQAEKLAERLIHLH